MTDLVPVSPGAIAPQQSQPPAALASVMGVSPQQLMSYAVEVANTLSHVLRDRGMIQKFGQGEHVKAEGWQLAGSLMGFVADEKGAHEHPDGTWEGRMGLKSLSTGRQLADASAICGRDEPNWRSKPKYALRSMALTRAGSRAYAQNFRWLIKLAGYEGTPAEEMPPEMAANRDTKPANYDEQRQNMAREIEAEKNAPPLDIPFPTEEIFTAHPKQMEQAKKDAKLAGIKDRATFIKACDAVQNVPMHALLAAFRDWLEDQPPPPEGP